MATGNPRMSPLVELGVTGLPQWGGVIYDEWLPELRGTLKRRVYREMGDNEPIIAASLFVYEMLIRNVTRGVQPATKDNAGMEAAEWLDGALYRDQSSTFSDFLSECIQSMLRWGVAPHEAVYKIRGGDVDDPTHKSMYTDGQYGFRKWPIRAYETLDHWVFDHSGGVQGMVQCDPMGGRQLAPIPIQQMLLFRMRQHKGSPEGVSLLRSVYKPWYCKQHIERMQNIGIARNLAGIPMVKVPAQILSPTATGNDLAMRNTLQLLVTALERDTVKGFLFPTVLDQHGNELYHFELISPGGDRASTMNTQDVIKQYNLEMLLAMMTAVIMVGHERVGSYSLHSSATEMLSYGLGAILDGIFDVINEYAVKPLWKLNGFLPQLRPTAIHGDIESQSLDDVANFVLKLSQAGFNVSNLEAEVMRRTGFPEPETDKVA